MGYLRRRLTICGIGSHAGCGRWNGTQYTLPPPRGSFFTALVYVGSTRHLLPMDGAAPHVQTFPFKSNAEPCVSDSAISSILASSAAYKEEEELLLAAPSSWLLPFTLLLLPRPCFCRFLRRYRTLLGRIDVMSLLLPPRPS